MSLSSYIRETRVEVRHVNWPSRKQAIIYTATVVGVSIVVAVLLSVFDGVFNYLLRLVLT